MVRKSRLNKKPQDHERTHSVETEHRLSFGTVCAILKCENSNILT